MRPLPVLLSALLIAAAPALAQTETPPGNQPTPNAQPPQTEQKHAERGTERAAKRPDRYHATLDERIQSMHQRLHITTAQEAAWNGFAQVMHDNANTIEQDYRQRSDTLERMSAADNLRDYARIEQDRAQGVQRLSAAFDTLYGQLSDEQKQTADTMFRHYDMNDHRGRRAQTKPQQ
ncbi:MAG TPA: Spy/CpxP family protein refolding chaperone [Rhodopila sp.]|nr:Spy/CpxP family protein refolding chaperone [Rhodopila sp.]